MLGINVINVDWFDFMLDTSVCSEVTLLSVLAVTFSIVESETSMSVSEESETLISESDVATDGRESLISPTACNVVTAILSYTRNVSLIDLLNFSNCFDIST